MAVDALVRRFMDERDQKVTLIETLAGTADDEGRDLYATDLETIDNARARIRELDAQIDKVSGDLQMADAVKSRIRTLDPNIVSRDFQYRSAGDYMYDLLHRSEDADANARFRSSISALLSTWAWIRQIRSLLQVGSMAW